MEASDQKQCKAYSLNDSDLLRKKLETLTLEQEEKPTAGRKQNPKFDVFLDFDGTILKENTIPWLDYLRQDPNAPFYHEFLEPYIKDYTKWKNEQGPSSKRRTLRQEYNYLESQLKIEEASIERIEASGWLKGVKWSHKDTSVFDNAVSQLTHNHEIQWRAGLEDLYRYVTSTAQGRVAILSVHWSEQFIRALLRTRGIKGLDIYCNEIDPNGSGHFSRHVNLLACRSSGAQIHDWPPFHSATSTLNRVDELDHIWTAFDKATVLWLKGRIGRLEDSLLVYVGDSKTDLRCLMDADIGIRMIDCDEEAGLSEILDRLHIRQLPIDRLAIDYIHENLVEAVNIETGNNALDHARGVSPVTTLVDEQWARKTIWVATDFCQIKTALEGFAEANKDTQFDFYKHSAPRPEASRQTGQESDQGSRRPSYEEVSRRDSAAEQKVNEDGDESEDEEEEEEKEEK